MALNLYPNETDSQSDFSLAFSKPKQEKLDAHSYSHDTVKEWYDPNPDQDGGARSVTVDKTKDKGDVPSYNIVTAIDSSSANIRPSVAIPDLGGAVYSYSPTQFAYKNLSPIANQNLSTPTRFDFSYGLGWHNPNGSHLATPASFNMEVYLTVALFDSNVLTRTGSLNPAGTAAPGSGFIPIINIRLQNLAWFYDGIYSGFLFDQPLSKLDLLQTTTRGSVSNGFSTDRDFRDTGDVNSRSRIDKDDQKLLLNGTRQIAVGVAIRNDNLTSPQNLFIINELGAGNLAFTLSYSFLYYARLVTL